MWTMEQLVERVSAALAAEYPGAPNGRVRELPDRRSIRWYTTIGLVDRPLGTRGRTVLYGPRHLLQLVAIKRRQASGRTLAEIQAELAGASEETLAEVARIPDSLLEAAPAQPPSPPARADFWKAAPTDPEPVVRSTRQALAETVASLRQEAAPPPAQPVADLVTGVPLGAGVILLLPRHLTDVDRDEIAAAARPLLDLLAARGLTDGRNE